jgi:Flp pilus assembly protein TadG
MNLRRPFARRHRRSERGAAMMLIALSLTGMIAVTGVIVDGGSAFAQRRQMQNAADAAAMAGTRAFDKMTTNGEAAVWSEVVAAATANGADSSQVTCRIVTELLVDLGSCPTGATGTAVALRTAASGVKVTVGATKTTSFIRIVGQNTFTARATATAQVEALLAGTSPFVLCATGALDSRSEGDGQSVPVLLPDNTVNPYALAVNGGPVYELQDPTVAGCGQGNQFKGLNADSDTVVSLPGPLGLAHGDHGINVAKTVVAGSNACRGGITLNCVVLVPLCHAASPPVDDVLYCERFGAFQIVDIQGSSRLGGYLVDGVAATGGPGGGPAHFGVAHVIKLSE